LRWELAQTWGPTANDIVPPGGRRAVREAVAGVIENTVEANAARQLRRIELDAQAAGVNSHFFSRHGAGTSIEDQYFRSLTGFTPDGFQKNVVAGSRFYTHSIQLQALQRAQTIYRQNGSRVFDFNMGFPVGEGYRSGGGPLLEVQTVRAVFHQNGHMITMFPLID